MFESILGALAGLSLLGLAIVTEVAAPRRRYSLISRVPGLINWVLFVVAGASLLYALRSLWIALAVPPIVVLPLPGLVGEAAAIATGVLLYDFLGYWHHRAQHRFLWPIHAVHHSQTELHAANAYSHFLEQGPLFLLQILPLSLISFQLPATPFIVSALLHLQQYYIHSPVNPHLGPLRRVFVDNRFHRIHHSLEPQHFDKNFGTHFTVWDRLFGTAYEPTAEEWPATGVEGHPPPVTPISYLLFPLRFMRFAPRDRGGFGSVSLNANQPE